MEVGEETISRVMRELGQRGGRARAQSMTAKERRESALKASRAAAAARTKKAKQKEAKPHP
jgi:hypothetical protein